MSHRKIKIVSRFPLTASCDLITFKAENDRPFTSRTSVQLILNPFSPFTLSGLVRKLKIGCSYAHSQNRLSIILHSFRLRPEIQQLRTQAHFHANNKMCIRRSPCRLCDIKLWTGKSMLPYSHWVVLGYEGSEHTLVGATVFRPWSSGYSNNGLNCNSFHSKSIPQRRFSHSSRVFLPFDNWQSTQTSLLQSPSWPL